VPAAFVGERSPDGRPHLSHAWWRTIDGVQGVTWTQVHLLATPALDNYRGYVGQSRSIQPTHTWDTIPTPDSDHCGRLVTEPGTPAEQVAAAVHKARPKTFAAGDDPHRIGHRLQQEIVGHRRALDQQPPHRQRDLDAARAALQQAETELAASRRAAEGCAAEAAEANSGLRRLTPGRRARRTEAEARVAFSQLEVDVLEQRVAAHAAGLAELDAAQKAHDRYGQANVWRSQRITELEAHLRDHWTDAVLGAARSGNPLAFGTARLRAAHQHLTERALELQSGFEQDDRRRRQAEADLVELNSAAKVAIQAREVQTRRARARAASAFPAPTFEPATVGRGVGPDL
jgi:hypothetical protein